MRNLAIVLAITVIASFGTARATAHRAISTIHVTVTPEDRSAVPTHPDTVRAIALSTFDRADLDLANRTLDLAVVESRETVRLRLCVTDSDGRMRAVVTAGARASRPSLRVQAIRDAMAVLADQLRTRS
jgi:hypothetical protein